MGLHRVIQLAGVTMLLSACAAHRADGLEKIEIREGDEGVHSAWQIHPSRDLVEGLVGAATLAECEALLASGEWMSCSTRVGSCMFLMIFPKERVLILDRCQPSDEVMLVAGPGETAKAIELRPPDEE